METFEHKSKKVEIEDSAQPKVTIDGDPVQISHDPEGKDFNTGQFPYRTFKSVRELAEAVVEQQLGGE